MKESPGPIARTRGVALQQVDDPVGKSLLAQYDVQVGDDALLYAEISQTKGIGHLLCLLF